MFVRISKLLDAEAARPDEGVAILKHLMAELQDFNNSDARKEARRPAEKYYLVARLADVRERVSDARITQIDAKAFDPPYVGT